MLLRKYLNNYNMFIYHSYPADVRVTVVGRYNVEKKELEIAVARCSKNDDFLKRTMVIPERPSFTVQTKNGPKVIPTREMKVIEGGVDIAERRLYNGEIFSVFKMNSFNAHQFNLIASGVADIVKNNPQLITESKHGK